MSLPVPGFEPTSSVFLDKCVTCSATVSDFNIFSTTLHVFSTTFAFWLTFYQTSNDCIFLCGLCLAKGRMSLFWEQCR